MLPILFSSETKQKKRERGEVSWNPENIDEKAVKVFVRDTDYLSRYSLKLTEEERIITVT